ncbi:MAG: hypothetical protein KDC39_14485 [Actinobacteria bacterium]|nr:hypothetical protein [Actinomycetota bacterium]
MLGARSRIAPVLAALAFLAVMLISTTGSPIPSQLPSDLTESSTGQASMEVRTTGIRKAGRRASTFEVKVPAGLIGSQMKVAVIPATLIGCVYEYECDKYVARKKLRQSVTLNRATTRFKIRRDFCKKPADHYRYAVNKADISYSVAGAHVGSVTPMSPNQVYPGTGLRPYPHFSNASGKVRRITGC